MYKLASGTAGLQKLLMVAITNGNKYEVANLLETDASLLNAVLDRGYTTLGHAISLNKSNIVEFLLTFTELSLNTGHSFYPEAEEFARFWGKNEITQMIADFKKKKQANSLELYELDRADRDFLFAWQLQAEEYKKFLFGDQSSRSSYRSIYEFKVDDHQTFYFSIMQTPGDRNCFFHAIDRNDLNRGALVAELVKNSHKEAVRNVFAQEIRQFLYLGHTGGHPDKAENVACKEMLKEEIRALFDEFTKDEKNLRGVIVTVRSILGEAITHGKTHEELLALLSQQICAGVNGAKELYDTIFASDTKFSDTERAIYDYCCQEGVFISYVNQYLGIAEGYIPFLRDLGGEKSTTIIDVINQLFGLKIQLYLIDKDNQLILINRPLTGSVINIFHNGVNHFSGLRSENSPSQLDEIQQSRSVEQMERTELNQDLHTKIQTAGKAIPTSAAVIDTMQMALLSLIETIKKVNKEFDGSLKNFQDQGIKRRLKDISLAIDKSLRKIESFLSLESKLKTTIETEIKRINYFIESRIGFIESESNNHIEKIQASELLGMITNAYLTLNDILNPKPILKLKSDSRWHEDKLRLEQQIMCKEPEVSRVLHSLLEAIEQESIISSYSVPNECFISYAWASEEYSHEKWIQPFLINFREHLRRAGVQAILDIKDNNGYGSIYQYMERAESAQCAIVVGTQSLFQKHKLGTHAVCSELILINRKRARNQGKTLPILLSGDFISSLPPYFSMYTTVRDWREKSYAANLKAALAGIYGIGPDNVEYNNIWKEFEDKYPVLMSGISKEDVLRQLKEEENLATKQIELDSQKATELFSNINITHNISEKSDNIVNELKNHSYSKKRSYISSKLELYVPPFSCDPNRPQALAASAEIGNKEPLLLLDEITEFFASDKLPILLLKGEAGTGKSLFGCYLENHYLDNCKKSGDPIFIFISLLEIKDPVNNLMNEWFDKKRLGEHAEEIHEYLKSRERVCFILDGFDEIDQFQRDPKRTENLYKTNELWRWRKAKFIISCRTTFLTQLAVVSGDQTYKKYFIPIDEMPRYELFKEAQIALFDKAQTNKYVDEYVKLYPGKLTAEQYKNNIKILPNVKQLISNALILSMTVQALPIIIEWHAAKRQKDPNIFISITARDVFMAYLKDSLIRQITKLDHKNLGGIGYLNKIRSELLNFLINLANRMKRLNLLKVEYKFCAEEVSDESRNNGLAWAKEFFGDPFLGLENHDQKLEHLERVRNGATCLIFYDGESWRFMHDSFIEKFYNIVVVELSNIASKLSPSDRPPAGQINKRVIDEFAKVIFSQAEGPYYLTGKHWSSSTYEASEISETEHSESEGLFFSENIDELALQLRRDSANPAVKADSNYIELVKKSVSLGAHLIQGPGSGNTALHFALIKGQMHKATILLQRVIEIDQVPVKMLEIKNTAGKTVLDLCSEVQDFPDEIRQLIESVANIQNQDATYKRVKF